MLAHRSGFAAIDAGAVLSVAVCACSVVMVAMGQGRKSAGLAGSLANLKKFGEVTGNYAADCEGLLWTFSWKAGDSLSQWDELNNAQTHLQAAANQAVDIIRRRFDEQFPRLDSWIPHIVVSALPLGDYLDEILPVEWFASPGDARLLELQRDPYAHGGWLERRWAFSSSYTLPTAFVSPDEYPTIRQAAYYSYFVPNDIDLGGRRVEEVAFPSGKVHLSEQASWFFGPRPAWYLESEARVPVLMMDGSAGARRTADANAAWDPRDPSQDDYIITYNPPADNYWEPRPLGGSSSRVSGRYRWTRRGLGGVDFDGERVD